MALGVIPFFIVAGIIIFLGFIGEIIFRKTNIPDVLWLIIFGIFIGSVFKWATPIDFMDFAPIFTTFALIFILFEGSLSINIKYLFREMLPGTAITIVNFILSVVVVTLVGLAMGWNLMASLLLGVILGGVSSAVVIPIAKNLGVKKETFLVLMIESAISDVLCIMGALAVINMINVGVFNLKETLGAMLSNFAVALVAGAVVGLLWSLILKKIERQSKSYMITIGILVILYGVVEYLGFSGAIAALAFGIILGNSQQILRLMNYQPSALSKSERFFYSEISFFVKSFFFVYLGILLNFSDYVLWIIGAIIAILLIAVRPLAVKVAVRGVEGRDRSIMEVLVPKGLAAAVLAQLAIQQGIENAEAMSNIVLAVVFVSIVLASIFIFLISRGYMRGLSGLYGELWAKITRREQNMKPMPRSPTSGVGNG